MKIDVFCHLMPRAYADRLASHGRSADAANLRLRSSGVPAMVDLDLRFRQMDEFGDDYRQVVSLPAPAVEDIDYACGRLGALGVQLYTHVNGHPMDEPRFEPVYRRMAELDRMIWVHPSRNSSWADYPTEKRSRYELWWVFGWEYDTALFMGRLVLSGVLERYPSLKVLIHHGGSMVPQFSGRVGPGLDQLGARTPPDQREDVEHYPLSRRPIDYFRMFYADTAMFGARHAIRCSLDFFGVDHVLFASDSPFDPEQGPGYIRATIANLEALDLTDEDRRLIYEGNARRLLGL